MRVGGGTSIMPRVAPTLYEFVSADDGEYLKVTEAVLRIFDRQEWLRANRARARIKVFVDKFGIEELQRQVEEELEGDWVGRARLRPRARCCFVHDEEAGAPRRAGQLRQPERRRQRVRALARHERASRSARRASRPSRSR